ncbi:flavin reductase family protein [Sphingomonas sp. 3P27F8]|uniref:flavin reductase family protein n=1 Tax=Sphingomonas sp. 3P27F8 TaxID=2502213 RepID=UPI0010F7D95F|nr:flavin reductase family protein [Sphingomonas sp. 3P27F8]
MRYQPDLDNHGLPHDPYLALVAPRPIGWITTLTKSGVVNLAPYSFFNIVGHRPSYLMFTSGTRRHSQANAEEQGEFVANMATYGLRQYVNSSSASFDAEESEAGAMELALEPSVQVAPPRVKLSPIAIECKYERTIVMPAYEGVDYNSSIVIGRVVEVYIDDSVIVDGMVDVKRTDPLCRLGYLDYGAVGRVFSLPRPTPEEVLMIFG